jgi:hypothetical protein
MRLARRGVVRGLTAVLVAAAAAADASARDTYPSSPISLILPYAAGGGTDAVARVFAKALEEKLGVGTARRGLRRVHCGRAQALGRGRPRRQDHFEGMSRTRRTA